VSSCFNLCPEQNQLNAERCAELGISGRVDITLGDFNKPWPAEWADAFDYIWSAEALCHAGDKTQLFGQLTRCLRKGGIVVFSDIMGSDTAEEEQLRAFTSRNATTALGRPSEYEALLKAAGLTRVAWWDNSHHLERYFRSMLSQIEAHQEQLVSQGVSQAYLDKWRASLTERADTQAAHHVFTWGVFVARKD
jgi:sarcosine/dimethylglycine N-methyltransferase